MKSTLAGLAVIGLMLPGFSALAQTGATTSAMGPDSLRPSASTVQNQPIGNATSDREARRAQRRMTRKNRRGTDQNARGRRGATTSANPNDYRQASENATAINNSNVTNNNVNAAITAPTGVGSNPAVSATMGASNGQNNSAARGGAPGASTPGASTGSVSSGSTMPATSAGSPTATGVSNGQNNSAARGITTGTGAAVAGNTNADASKTSNAVRERIGLSVGDFAASSPEYLTLQNALQATDLTDVLRGTGPFTVFAPSNAAFRQLPTDTQNNLLQGRNRNSLKQLLTYHVVPGSIDAEGLRQRLKAGGGLVKLQTLAGGTLTLRAGSGGKLLVADERGNVATIDAPDQQSTNGVVHGIDRVLMTGALVNAFR